MSLSTNGVYTAQFMSLSTNGVYTDRLGNVVNLQLCPHGPALDTGWKNICKDDPTLVFHTIVNALRVLTRDRINWEYIMEALSVLGEIPRRQARAATSICTDDGFSNQKNLLLWLCSVKGGPPIEAIQIVLDTNPDAVREVDSRNRRTPLHWAVASGASVGVLELLRNGFPDACKQRARDDMTPLEVAVKSSQPVKTIGYLLEHYTDVSGMKDPRERTLLTFALESPMPFETIEFLLQKFRDDKQLGGIWNISSAVMKDKSGRTPLHFALFSETVVSRHAASTESFQILFRFLLEQFPDAIRDKDIQGKTPLHVALESSEIMSRYRNNTEVFQALIAAYPGALSVTDNHGSTPLHRAVANRAGWQIVKLLLKDNVKILDAPDRNGWTPLHQAVARSKPNLEIIRLLLETKPSAICKKDKEGKTPIHLAAQSAKWQTIKLLLKHNDKVLNITDNKGNTPLHVAAGNLSTTEEFISLLLDVAPENLRNETGNTPLHIAARNFKAPATVLVALLETWPKGAREQNLEGKTPLFVAVEAEVAARKQGANANHEKISLLFEAFPSAVNEKDILGQTIIGKLLPRMLVDEKVEHLLYGEYRLPALDNRSCSDVMIMFKLFLQGVRDGREFRLLVTSKHETTTTAAGSLRTFLSLMSTTTASEKDMLELNLNDEPIRGWTMLEILVDFDIEEAWVIFSQIYQQLKGCNKMKTVEIKNKENQPMISFVSLVGVTKQTWRKVADRAKLLVNVPELKNWGTKYGRLFGIYRLGDVQHMSETCVVIFATRLDVKGNEMKVALKFMEDDAYFRKELSTRQRILNKTSVEEARENIILVNKAFSSSEAYAGNTSGIIVECRDDFAREISLYEDIKLSGNDTGQKPVKHLLEMCCGLGDDLSDVISHQHIAGKNMVSVCQIALSIAMILRFLNEKCGVIHGDVKARNFVAWKTGGQCIAIDFDNSSVDATTRDGNNSTLEMSGFKDTSSGYLPPEQASALHALRTKDIAVDKTKISKLVEDKEKYQKKLNTSYKADEDIRLILEEKIQSIQKEINELATNPEETAEIMMIPDKPSEMWRFGVLLYQLCTGKNLFHIDNQEQVNDNSVLNEIREWSDKDLEGRLCHISDDNWGNLFKPLLKNLLQRDPKKRPKKWNGIINTLEGGFTSHHFSTLRDGLTELQMSNRALEETLVKKLKTIHSDVDRLIKLSSFSAPRLMLVVPEKLGMEEKLNLTALVNKKVKIVFVCPVSLLVPRNKNSGDMMGYEFKLLKDWYQKWGWVLRISFIYLSLALATGGSELPSAMGSLPQSTKSQSSVEDLFFDEVKMDIEKEPKDLDLAKQRSTYAEVMKAAQDDDKFLSTGLSRTYCKSDQTMEYVLDIPQIKKLYRERGRKLLRKGKNQSFVEPEVWKGYLKRKERRKPIKPAKRRRAQEDLAKRYYVLRIHGHLTYYKDEEDYRRNYHFGIKGKTQPRYSKVSSVPGDYHRGFRLDYLDGTHEVLLAETSDHAGEWISKLKEYAYSS